MLCYTLGPAALDGQDVASAAVSEGALDGLGVDVALTRAGLARFNELASKQFGRPAPTNEVALVVDGRVVSAPVIESPHFETSYVRVAGRFSAREAKSVAAAIGPPPKPSSSSTTSAADRTEAAAERAAAQLCDQHRNEFPVGTTVQYVAAHTASEAVASIRLNGGDPAPWERVPADEFVAECSYANLTTMSTQSTSVCANGTIVIHDPAALKHYYFDRAGRRSEVAAPPLSTDPCDIPSPQAAH